MVSRRGMMMSAKTWLAAYLYYGEPWQALLARGIKPLTETLLRQTLADRFFFIRYWERGPHIRLRFLTDAARKGAVENHLTTWFEDYVEAHPSERSFSEPENGPPLLPNNSLVFTPYEPETERYGGPVGLPISEKQFEASSRAVLSILADAEDWDYDRALGSAIQLHLGFAHAVGMSLEELRAFFLVIQQSFHQSILNGFEQNSETSLIETFEAMFEQQRDALVPFCRSLWDGLGAGAEFDQSWFNAWFEDMSSLAGELGEQDRAGRLDFNWQWPNHPSSESISQERKSLWRLYTSYVHMTNNRLGILNQDEVYLAFLLARVTECL